MSYTVHHNIGTGWHLHLNGVPETSIVGLIQDLSSIGIVKEVEKGKNGYPVVVHLHPEQRESDIGLAPNLGMFTPAYEKFRIAADTNDELFLVRKLLEPMAER
jgi:hypothetical protein